MKKIIALSVLTVFFAACKKDYTCECTTAGTTSKTTIKSATKRQAKANCYSSSVTYSNVAVETTCTLK